jgi:hypothetical protein
MARLSARPIVGYQNINSFKFANQWQINAGDTVTLYYELIDLDQCGLRYIAGGCVEGVPVGMNVTFPSIDCNQVLKLVAQQSSCDGSIWSVSISSISTPQTGNVQFQLFEGNNVTNFSVKQLMVVNYSSDGSDGSLPDNTFFF